MKTQKLFLRKSANCNILIDGPDNFIAWLSGQYMCICKNIQYFNVIYECQEKDWNNAKKIAKAFRDNEKMMFRPKFEEVVATLLTSKNKLRELVGNIKKQGISSENKDSRK